MRYSNLFIAIFIFAASSVSYAGTLVINSDQSDPVPKAAFQNIVKIFEKENPDIQVKYTIFDHEAYKTALRNWLATSPPDVIHWYAGNRMKQFVGRSLFDDVSDIWQSEKLSQHMPTALSAMTIDGKQWGVPYTYYQWGIYYRKDIFKKLKIKEPKTWDEFLAACKKIKADGLTPIAIGTKYLWPAAGWFDYLNLRTNGLEFHQQLMDGKASYTDPKIRQVFDYWQQLIKPEYFLTSHATYSWQEALPFLLNGKAAMYLLGNFITHSLGEKEKDIGFFQFPTIKPSIGVAENAPMDTLHIPSKAKNKADARKFLKFMARKDIQTKINKTISQIPPHKEAQTPDHEFLKIGVKMLQSAAGTTQFYDRNTSPAIAKEGMKGFQQFMIKPDRLEKILKSIDKVRQREMRRRK